MTFTSVHYTVIFEEDSPEDSCSLLYKPNCVCVHFNSSQYIDAVTLHSSLSAVCPVLWLGTLITTAVRLTGAWQSDFLSQVLHSGVYIIIIYMYM